MNNQNFFSNELWKDSRTVYERILEHPFIKGLCQGTLSIEQFGFYMQQDALYLVDFSRALSCIAAKMNGVPEIVQFLRYAMCAIAGERELHTDYFNYYKIDPGSEKNEACFVYTHYLLSTSALEAVEIAVAAVLPCLWVYRGVGLHVYKNSVTNNPFEKWIDTYSSEEFSEIVNEAIILAEKIYESVSPAIKQSMKRAVYQAVCLEWKFWDDAYRLNHHFKETSSSPMAY